MKYECNYPEGFHNFYNGVDISDAEINGWIKKCIQNLEENIERTSSYISSGNTMVQVYRFYFDENSDRYYYTVYVSKGYYSKDVGLEFE